MALQLLENLEFPEGAPWKSNDVKETTAGSGSKKRKSIEPGPATSANHILDRTQQPVVVNRHNNTPPCLPPQKRRRAEFSFPMNVATLALEKLTKQEIGLLLEKYQA